MVGGLAVGDASGAGVGKAGDAANRYRRAGGLHRIDQVDILGTEIGNDELRAVWSQGKSAQPGVRRRTARRVKLEDNLIELQIEDIDVIDVREIKALALGIVEQKPVERGF